MEHDEHEMLVEYSEMTAFNFNSKEYQEVEKDLMECKKTADNVSNFVQNFMKIFRPQAI